jgi:hypothetical protein
MPTSVKALLPRSGVLISAAIALVTLQGPTVMEARQAADDLTTILSRAGARVEEFFTRAQRIVCLEVVELQPLAATLTPQGFGRTVVSELRLTWEPGVTGAATEAQTRRQVLAVNGRPPRRNDRDTCTSPEQQEEETQPLSMLLPSQRAKYSFSPAGTTRMAGRDATVVDFRELGTVWSEVRLVEGVEDCISYDVKGGQRGRLWIDRETSDVLRMDQSLPGMVDLRMPPRLTRRMGASAYMTLERSDTTIRFGRVTFSDPDETIVLPLESTEMRVVRNGGTPRLRTTTRYTDYKRFLTDGRLLGGTATPDG